MYSYLFSLQGVVVYDCSSELREFLELTDDQLMSVPDIVEEVGVLVREIHLAGLALELLVFRFLLRVSCVLSVALPRHMHVVPVDVRAGHLAHFADQAGYSP